MKNKDDAIRQENKKAMPKFIVLMVISLVVGAALGLLLVFLSLEDFGSVLKAAGLFFTNEVAFWLLVALPVVELALCLPIYFGANKQLAAWDGEDEAVSGEIEARLSVGMWITGMATILAFFLASALFSGFVTMAGDPAQIRPVKFWGGLAAFIVGGLFVTVLLQQKIVDITKKLNPEKQGSVYDTKFQKKWFESCDEAERAAIGQCAFKAYRAMCHTCLGLWAVFGLGGMFFDWGFLPAMAVCIVWAVGQSVYSYACIKPSKPSAPPVL